MSVKVGWLEFPGLGVAKLIRPFGFPDVESVLGLAGVSLARGKDAALRGPEVGRRDPAIKICDGSFVKLHKKCPVDLGWPSGRPYFLLDVSRKSISSWSCHRS